MEILPGTYLVLYIIHFTSLPPLFVRCTFCVVFFSLSLSFSSGSVLVVSQLNSSHAAASDWGDSSDADGENRRVVGDRTRGSG